MNKYIKILTTPPGQAPVWVRDKWVGLSIPLLVHPRRNLKQTGVLGGAPNNINGYVVSAKTAIACLEQVAPDAARWWQHHLLDIDSSELVFDRNVCQISELRKAQSIHPRR